MSDVPVYTISLVIINFIFIVLILALNNYISKSYFYRNLTRIFMYILQRLATIVIQFAGDIYAEGEKSSSNSFQLSVAKYRDM